MKQNYRYTVDKVKSTSAPHNKAKNACCIKKMSSTSANGTEKSYIRQERLAPIFWRRVQNNHKNS